MMDNSIDSHYDITIQHVCSTDITQVTDEQIQHWASITLQHLQITRALLTVRLVSPTEIQSLNAQYRQKDKPTNVLAFPSDLPPMIFEDYPFLGDVILCPAVLQDELAIWGQDYTAHFAHILIHGILHLLGYDHLNTTDETIMQTKEIAILVRLGFSNPYME